MAHTCLRCDLRFRDRSELRDHLALDHGVEGEVLEDYRYPASGDDPQFDSLRHSATDTRPTDNGA